MLRENFDVIRPQQIEDALSQESLRLPVLITFDDGYRDNHELAVPALLEQGLAAVFFIATGPLVIQRGLWTSELWRLGSRLPAGPLGLPPGAPGQMPQNGNGRRAVMRALTRWMSSCREGAREHALDHLARRAGVPRGEGLENSFLTPAHLRQMRDAGMALGAHTRSHPHLDRLDPRYHAEETKSSRRDLESLLGHPVTWFAYPNPGGHAPSLEASRTSVKDSGFTHAFTSQPRPILAGVDRLMLPRVGVYRGEQEETLFAVADTIGHAR